MNYENELSFFCEILEKCHINTSVLSMSDSIMATVDPRLLSVVSHFIKSDTTVKTVFGNIESKTKYVFSSEFRLNYICLKLPCDAERNILFIGPYLSSMQSTNDILEIGERVALSPTGQRFLKEYYSTLPVISDNDRIFAITDAFCERIWDTASFSIEKYSKSYTLPLLSTDGYQRSETDDEILATAEMMEMRYAYENELIRAVSLGQQHKDGLLLAAFDDQMFEKRLQDPVRNAKNYCIIMNTLLRKAAEEGGVHPLHIDKLSSKYAARIEMLTDTKNISEFMRDMFLSYCRLVHKHSTRKYSPVVKKAIILIDADLSAELSLGIIARALGVSGGYLATVFKKETGKTLSEYVRDKRIGHAKHLLSTTHLQIQTVALHCGIMDVQYFTKLFKKQVGKTPKEYRSSARE